MSQIQQSVVPRYHQLKEILERRVLSGEFQPGEKFPTEDELCRTYGLSRGTVRQALDKLVGAGLLRREQGRGTFVNPPQKTPVFFRLAGFEEEMKARGWQPSVKLLSRRVLPAGKELAKRLKIRPGEKAIEIIRLRLADGKPVAYETRFLSYKTCPQLLKEDLETQSIHSLLIDKYNIPLRRASYVVEARTLSKKEAAHLQAEEGAAGFAIERITYGADNKPVTWHRMVYRGDVYRFSAEF